VRDDGINKRMNKKMNLRRIRAEAVNCLHLVYHRTKWLLIFIIITNIQVIYDVDSFLYLTNYY